LTISACAYDQIQSWAALKKKSGEKICNFLVVFFLGASTLPPQNTDTNMKKKSSEFFLYETETICDAAPHFCLFFSHTI